MLELDAGRVLSGFLPAAPPRFGSMKLSRGAASVVPLEIEWATFPLFNVRRRLAVELDEIDDPDAGWQLDQPLLQA
jgi:hypothetical protein